MCWVLLQYATLHGVCKDASKAESLYTFAPPPVPRTVVQGTPGHAWVHPAAHICCETWLLSGLIPGWLQNNAEVVPYLSTQKCFTPLQSTLLSQAFPFSDSLTLSCGWAFLSSMKTFSSVKNFHCNLNFCFIAKTRFRIWEWSRKGRVVEYPQKRV